MGCTDKCKVVSGWRCETTGTDPDFISTCTPKCGSELVDPDEACDIGNS